MDRETACILSWTGRPTKKAINFGANSDRRSEPNTVHPNIRVIP